MDVIDYFRTNFSIENLLGFNSDKNKTIVKHYVTLLNRKYDYKMPRVTYAVDYIGLNIANSMEKSDHYTFLLENTPKDTIFLFADLLHFSKGGDFKIKPQIVGILSTVKIEPLLNYEILDDLGSSHNFYVKKSHVQ